MNAVSLGAFFISRSGLGFILGNDFFQFAVGARLLHFGQRRRLQQSLLIPFEVNHDVITVAWIGIKAMNHAVFEPKDNGGFFLPIAVGFHHLGLNISGFGRNERELTIALIIRRFFLLTLFIVQGRFWRFFRLAGSVVGFR